MTTDKKANDGGFDLILAIPCERIKGNYHSVEKIAEESFGKFNAKKMKLKNNDEWLVQNVAHFEQKDIEGDIKKHAEVFCSAIEAHGSYELIFDDSIKTEREPLLYGNVIIYGDMIGEEKRKPIEDCYNFFCILSKLSIAKDRRFNIIYFVVPDINYDHLTLLMDQSHELWCNINEKKGDVDSPCFLEKHLIDIGYKCFGKIYHIVFSDSVQFKETFPDLNTFIKEKDMDNNTKKIFNILAAETRKSKEAYSQQLELSDNADEYIINLLQGNIFKKCGLSKEESFYDKSFALMELAKREKFYDEYNMYSSYRAFASLYTYYYIIDEDRKKPKLTFSERITPDPRDEDFSSIANILFVLETELFKVSACLVLNKEIGEQMHNPELDLREIRKMFKHFIETRPLFEKLNYYYLGAQKEADFIYKQFRIGDMIADYERKRELLRNYSEVFNSIVADKNSKRLQFISLVFPFLSAFSILKYVSHMLIRQGITLTNEIDYYIFPFFVFVIIILLIFRPFERLLKRLLNKLKKTGVFLLKNFRRKYKSTNKPAGD